MALKTWTCYCQPRSFYRGVSQPALLSTDEHCRCGLGASVFHSPRPVITAAADVGFTARQKLRPFVRVVATHLALAATNCSGIVMTIQWVATFWTVSHTAPFGSARLPRPLTGYSASDQHVSGNKSHQAWKEQSAQTIGRTPARAPIPERVCGQ
jgi:hypothetical protein